MKMYNNLVERIPVEILFNIFRQLSIKDLENCSLVCKQWNTLINDLYLWLPKCYQKLYEHKWIDKQLINLLKLCGIDCIKVFFRNYIDKTNKLHPKSGYYMRKLFYYLHLLPRNNLISSNQIYSYNHEENIVYYKCIIIGPAMDSSRVNQSIIKHIFKLSIWNQLPDDFIMPDPYLGTKTKLIGKNIMIGVPRTNIIQDNITIVKMTCIIPQNGELLNNQNRISGIYLLDNESIHDSINFIPEIEISILLNILHDDQSLLIIGVTDEYGQQECLTIIDLVDKLQCILFNQSTNDTLEDDLILNKPSLQWRLWLTTSNGEDYDNFTEMINWGLYKDIK
ncbi:unnamed protein product [Heterobilharzia americana]|nr:unnamed protein product [Heterobilharzia americana]